MAVIRMWKLLATILGLFCLKSVHVHGLVSNIDGLTGNSLNISASRVCKPGPPLTGSLDTTKKCLVIGDSVSIGYTPWLKTALQDFCQVYHSPWDTVDGGALDTKYAVKCLSFFLASNLLKPIKYDAIIFNFGLHDVNYNGSYLEEFTDKKTYRENLLAIKEYLQKTDSLVGYVLTTPIPFNVTSNDRVKSYNMVAREVMDSGKAVPVADLYNWVVLVCGEPPYNRCVIADKQPSPHYTKQGYKYLSVLIEHLIRNLQTNHGQNKQSTAKKDSKSIRNYIEEDLNKDTTVQSCKDETGKTVTKCPQTMTCSPSKYSMSGWGCCPLSKAVSCKDGKHCCPKGYECDQSCNELLCFCIKEQGRGHQNNI